VPPCSRVLLSQPLQIREYSFEIGPRDRVEFGTRRVLLDAADGGRNPAFGDFGSSGIRVRRWNCEEHATLLLRRSYARPSPSAPRKVGNNSNSFVTLDL